MAFGTKGKQKSNQAVDTTLTNRSNVLEALFEKYFGQAAAPDPLTEEMRGQDLDWLQTTGGKKGPIDVSKLMPAQMALYERAKSNQDYDKQGTGLLQMGAYGSDPNLVAKIKEQRAAEAQQAAAGQLENAFHTRDAQVRGEALDLSQMKIGKDLSLAGMAGGRADNATSNWLGWKRDRANEVPFWKQALLAAIAGSSQMASAYAGGGAKK